LVSKRQNRNMSTISKWWAKEMLTSTINNNILVKFCTKWFYLRWWMVLFS
jgi:hypothetical protein